MAGRSVNVVLQFAILILITFEISSANYHQIYKTFTSKKTLPTNHTILQPVSEIKCVQSCFEEGRYNRCSIAGYNRATNECFLSSNSEQDVVDVTDEMLGVFLPPAQASGSGVFADSLSDCLSFLLIKLITLIKCGICGI